MSFRIALTSAVISFSLGIIAFIPPREVPVVNHPMPTLVASVAVNQQHVECVAKVIYWEARGEGVRGQIAVAFTVINRAAHAAFPSSPCEVVEQPRQFAVSDRRKPTEAEAWEAAQEIAYHVLAGVLDDPTGGALWFHSGRKPWWARTRKLVETVRVGGHVFYGERV